MQSDKLAALRTVITENLRVQRDGEKIDYINVGNTLTDATAKQNHAIFARRGCGKTLLLHHSARTVRSDVSTVYLNCEDFKQHTFPNVLIEILAALFREMEKNLSGWFGKKKKSKQIVQGIIAKLSTLQKAADVQDEEIKQVTGTEDAITGEASLRSKAASTEAKLGGSATAKRKEEVQRTFKAHKAKLQELDHWLPRLKEQVREFFMLSKHTKTIFLQIDDLYHLKRTDQAFVVDYIHRLCKDVPLFFKIATIRHASTLYADREGQPVGAQERHDYQPINIDYTFADFKRTKNQNWEILEQFARKAGMKEGELEDLFKGEGFARLVMAGGGVPRDVLSLFLEILGDVDKIGKDEVRILSRANFERRIEELKQDSQGDEQDGLLRGIYVIREFCLDKKTNAFVVLERMLQQDEQVRSLFYRLMDYRIIHNAGNALTHKSQPGTYQAFVIDIGCYAHLRKLQKRFAEIDVAASDAKEKMRSAPVLDKASLEKLSSAVPSDVETALLAED